MVRVEILISQEHARIREGFAQLEFMRHFLLEMSITGFLQQDFKAAELLSRGARLRQGLPL